MLAISAAFDLHVSSFAHLLAQLQLKVPKTGDGSIVHEAVSSEDERMVVDGSHWGFARCSHMRHEDPRLGVGADGAEVQVFPRWLDALVHGGTETFLLRAVSRFSGVAFLEVGIRGSIPHDTGSVNVADYIPGCDEGIFGNVSRVLCHQSG